MQATDRRLLPAFRWAGVWTCLALGGLAALAQSPGARVTVADVIVQGNRQVQTQQITALLKTKPGAEYVPEVVQEDVRALYKTGQFSNINVDVKEEDGRVKVYFLIRDYPNVVQEIKYQGAKHLSEDDLNQITGLRKGGPLNPVANKLACQAIVRRYNEDGRAFAACDLLSGGQPGDTSVIFNITEGPVVAVSDILFTGNTFVSGAVLKTHLYSGERFLGVIGGKYNPQMVEADLAKLEEYYRSFGFHDVQVAREVQYAPAGNTVVLIFHIVEGRRYLLKEHPRVIGAKNLPVEKLEQLSKYKGEQFYSEADVQEDVTRIKNYYGYEGRDVKVQAVPFYPKETPGIVQVQYEVEERPPARVGCIYIVGNERTRQNIILRQLPIYPGQPLSYPDLRVAEARLARLGIFDMGPEGEGKPTVTVLNPEAEGEFKDVLVTVKEADTGSLMFGVGVNSDAGLTGSIVLNERNFDITRWPTSFDDLFSGRAFRGAGQEFRIEAVPGTQVQRYQISFREPYLFDTTYSFSTSAYYLDRVYNEYTENRYGGRFGIGKKLDEHWSVNAGIRIENVNVSNVSVLEPPDYTSQVGNHFQTGFRVGATYDTTDSIFRPTRGEKVDVSYEQMVGDHDFPLFNLSADKFFTLYQRADGSGKHVLNLHSAFGWAGSNTPVYERFFAGGFRSLRGFAFRGVGPEVDGYNVGGDFLLLNSIEYQIPIKADDKFYFVTFVDSGTVESRISDIKNYRVSAGFGVRFQVPMFGQVPIALDFGFPINKAPGDSEQVFSFWLGIFR